MDLTTRNNIALITRHKYCTPEMLSREISIVKLLIRDGVDINITNEKGQNALMLSRDKKIINFLIYNGANVNARDNDHKTPLMYAKTLDIIQILIRGGADINAQDIFGNIAVMYTNSRAIIEYYVACGVNLSIQNNEKKTSYDHISKYISNLTPIYMRLDTHLNSDFCAICLENLSHNVCKLQKCNHFFHVDCINDWLKVKFTCPNCRQKLKN